MIQPETQLLEAIENDDEREALSLVSPKVANIRGEYEVPVLQLAITRDMYQLANALLDAGADVNARSQVGHNALHDVLNDLGHASRWLKTDLYDRANELFERILDMGPELTGSKESWSLLEEAAGMGLDMIMLRLISLGQDPNDESLVVGPLYAAVRGGHPSTVELLLRDGADANRRDGAGQVPLIHAASAGYHEITRLLLEWGKADPNITTPDGKSPLMFASATGAVSIVELLIEAGAFVTHRDDEGQMARDYAAMHDGAAAIPVLDSAGGLGDHVRRLAYRWRSRGGKDSL